MAGMKKIWRNNLHVTSNIKFLQHKMDGLPASQTNITHFIDPYGSHMDNKFENLNKNEKQCCFSFSSRLHRNARKGPYVLLPVPQQSPQGCPQNRANICLVEHRSFSTLEVGMSATSFLHSSFLQAVSAVMLWPVHVQKVLQASEHLCPAKLQARCDI